MRRTGWLLLVCCLALAGAVGWVYQQQVAEQSKAAPKKPASLPAGFQSRAGEGWVWTKTDGEKTIAEVRAKEFTQQTDPPRVFLQDVELKVFHKDDTTYDLIRSAKAELRTEDGVMFADGDVNMTMGFKADPAMKNRLVRIKTSGVTYSTMTGKVSTDRKAEFAFENSTGSATGAIYDPALRELQMQKDVDLHWTKGKKKMRVESGELAYKEQESKIYLKPWSRLTRESLTLNAGAAVVTLNEGEIGLVEAENANGEDKQPKRVLEYAADQLVMRFADKNAINRIEGERNAKLVTTSDTGRTTVTAQHVDMDFETPDGESVLKKALARGGTTVENVPPKTATRIMRSEVVELAMRAGGEEIDTIVTHTPGEVEFLPKAPAERYRKMNGERIWINYGPKNQLEKFRASKVTTFTKGKPAPKGKPENPDSKTSSEDLLATFDPKTGDMSRLEQWTNFQYEEGERRAKADHAKLEQATEHITLTGTARIWDPSGSTDASTIELDQKTGDMVATEKVVSTRLPDKKTAKPKSSLIDSSETIQARAAKMTTQKQNTWIRYEGGATMWQGADKLEAETITIDRKAQLLTANGKVFTQTRERPKANAKQPQAQLFTLVRAPELEYRESEKLAYYKGGVNLVRGDLKVNSQELRAWFSKDDPKTPVDEGNSLQRANADGSVDILQSAADRTRTGKGDHAVYEIAESKVVLTGGAPVFTDSLQGTTRGQTITWFSDNDRLMVDGADAKPTESRLKRNQKKSGK
ncbi:MAG: LPS export ABC transporter periplasmic protein LptC [Acidobacteria bacterium]|nr:LPS export ABC transporter periplasmic protein LptC [Acidobacteriota bacterium]